METPPPRPPDEAPPKLPKWRRTRGHGCVLVPHVNVRRLSGETITFKPPAAAGADWWMTSVLVLQIADALGGLVPLDLKLIDPSDRSILNEDSCVNTTELVVVVVAEQNQS